MTTNEPTTDRTTFQGREAFGLALLRQAAQAAALPRGPVAHELIWADEDFRDWPLDDARLIADLTAFLRQPGRRLRLVAQDWSDAEARHPRFARWRRDWAHAIDAQAGTEPLGLRPMALGAGVLIEVLDPTLWRGQCHTEAVARAGARVQIETWLASCEPGWPVTTLGL